MKENGGILNNCSKQQHTNWSGQWLIQATRLNNLDVNTHPNQEDDCFSPHHSQNLNKSTKKTDKATLHILTYMWFRLSNLSPTVNFSNGENPWTKKNENKRKQQKNHIRFDGYIEIVGEIDEIHKQGPKGFSRSKSLTQIFQLG